MQGDCLGAVKITDKFAQFSGAVFVKYNIFHLTKGMFY